MQYIISQDELDYFKSLETSIRNDRRPSEANLQKMCTKIANEWPVKWGWHSEELVPWVCILDDDGKIRNSGYCDSCPVQNICPNPNKQWSK